MSKQIAVFSFFSNPSGDGKDLCLPGQISKLYDHPNSLFVASFVGTPQINKLTCRVVRENGVLTFVCGELVMQVPMERCEGREVIVGIRPSELQLDPDGVGELTGSVDGVEPLGDGFIVYFNVAGQVLVAKIAGGSTKIGKTISVNVESGKIHVFDIKTEERIS